MRKALPILLLAVLLLAPTGEAGESPSKKERCVGTHQAINYYRGTTHKWQQKMGHPITKASKKPILGCSYARWVAKLWQKRSRAWRLRYEEYQSWLRRMSNPIEAIKYVFGKYATQALVVSKCETGGTFSVYATNGQYLGLFQMGSNERATYGHGNTPLEQARAAYAYFAASGYDWSPWSCKPDGRVVDLA